MINWQNGSIFIVNTQHQHTGQHVVRCDKHYTLIKTLSKPYSICWSIQDFVLPKMSHTLVKCWLLEGIQQHCCYCKNYRVYVITGKVVCSRRFWIIEHLSLIAIQVHKAYFTMVKYHAMAGQGNGGKILHNLNLKLDWFKCEWSMQIFKNILKNSLMQYLFTAFKIFQNRHGSVKYIKWVRHSKGKAIPLQVLTDAEGSRRLRLPDFKTIGTWRC
jgi:hypothetical protein